ncbi:hypothetical protein I203_101157 [Kwoniella mangroviensis CBS 8507]|uniref:uncharacterized protein n=1 Tax=Kwoniella mangroviensis CBS 8507 TaxID=1296122 RepID=UPI00080D6CCB|nr:uncharacterized protein I203_02791 [Kwoniella mangroviensis CBS 8507]OCF68130.1 hypothetical protein I203_02791 [Kwoniella mangroviensis CBS 8507]
MSISYSCSHLDSPHASLPPSYPSSSSSYHRLDRLYFCEECDAVRCDQCVAIEIASYFCPNCLFDVPSANVRADKNRCARSCFSCPTCESSLSIQASDQPSESGQPGPPYILICPGCKWSSKEVGWNYEKPTGIALQLQKMNTQSEIVQSEFDSLKDHLESYISLSTSNTTTSAPSSVRSTRNPSRQISHLTQMAQKALHRDVGGMVAYSARVKRPSTTKDGEKEKYGWDELAVYEAKENWRKDGMGSSPNQVDVMKELGVSGADGVAELGKRWGKSWDAGKMTGDILPQRIPLQTKLTKRCPHPNCRHLLIQPDTKSVRMKIKMVAANYLPLIEIGRRRRRLPSNDIAELPELEEATSEELERRRRERRRTRAGIPNKEEDESMESPLKSGETYSFQLALTNPLYDPIQIRLTRPNSTSSTSSQERCNVIIPTPHFTINALKDAWAYDEEYEDDGNNDFFMGGSEAGFSEEGTTTTTTTGGAGGTIGKKSRLSILGGGSSTKKVRGRDRENGVEKKSNTSKVNLDIEISPNARKGDAIKFDLEIRYTYRSDETVTPTDTEGKAKGGKKEEYKDFTFWIRVDLGRVE